MEPDQHDKHLEEDVQAYMDVIFQDLLITKQTLKEIQHPQENDPLCQEVAGTVEKVGQRKDELKVWLNNIIQYCLKYQL